MDESKALVFMKLFREDWDRNSKTENAKALDVAIKALEEMQKIKELGDCYIIPKNGVWEVNGVDIHEAIEKQIAKKMDSYYCPVCRHYFEDGEEHNYCPSCGQKLAL